MKLTGRKHTPAETSALVDRLRAEGKLPPRGSARALADRKPLPESDQPKYQSGIGDCVKLEAASIGAKMSETCRCEAVKKRMNSMTPEQVLEKISELTDAMMANVKDLAGLVGFGIKTATALMPSLARRRVRRMIERCCDQAVTRQPE